MWSTQRQRILTQTRTEVFVPSTKARPAGFRVRRKASACRWIPVKARRTDDCGSWPGIAIYQVSSAAVTAQQRAVHTSLWCCLAFMRIFVASSHSIIVHAAVRLLPRLVFRKIAQAHPEVQNSHYPALSTSLVFSSSAHLPHPTCVALPPQRVHPKLTPIASCAVALQKTVKRLLPNPAPLLQIQPQVLSRRATPPAALSKFQEKRPRRRNKARLRAAIGRQV